MTFKLGQMLQRVCDLQDELKNIITNHVQEGQTINLMVDDGNVYDHDELYSMPSVIIPRKYQSYDQYAITKIEKQNDDILLHAVGTGENSDKKTLHLQDLDVAELAHLADLVLDNAL